MSQSDLLVEASSAATTALLIPSGGPAASAVVPLRLPGELYVVRARKGQRETVICPLDLSAASVSGNAVAPAWSSPALVISAYSLGSVYGVAETLLHELFGADASLKADIETDPDTGIPMLVFRMGISRELRGLRNEFLDRYIRETQIPPGAPVPVLSWTYDRAASA